MNGLWKVLISWSACALGLITAGFGWFSRDFTPFGIGLSLILVGFVALAKSYFELRSSWERMETDATAKARRCSVAQSPEKASSALEVSSEKQEEAKAPKTSREVVYERLQRKLERELRHYEQLAESKKKLEKTQPQKELKTSQELLPIQEDDERTSPGEESFVSQSASDIASIGELNIEKVLAPMVVAKDLDSSSSMAIVRTRCVFEVKPSSEESVDDINDLARLVAKMPPMDGRTLIITQFEDRFCAEDGCYEVALRYDHRIRTSVYFDICEEIDLVPHIYSNRKLQNKDLLGFLFAANKSYEEIVIFLPRSEISRWRPVIMEFQRRQRKIREGSKSQEVASRDSFHAGMASKDSGFSINQ